MCLFTLRIRQDPVWLLLLNSGGASLPPLTRWPAGSAAGWLPPESGNMRTRRLWSGEGPKRSVTRIDVSTRGASSAVRDGMVP